MTGGPGAERDRRVVLGRIVGAFGVTGWVKVESYTEPAAGLLDYPRLLVAQDGGWREFDRERGETGVRGLRLKLSGVDDRDTASGLTGAQVAVARSEMPRLADGEFYLSDLEGLEVVSVDGEVLGRLDHFIETAAHRVMVIRGDAEHLVPLVGERLVKIDLAAGRVVVDWQSDWS